MYREDKYEFKACIRAAMWNWLDKMAQRMDKAYARQGIKKREIIKKKSMQRKQKK